MENREKLLLFDLGGVLVELGGVDLMMEWTGGRFSEEQLWHEWLTCPHVHDFETGRTEPDEFARAVVAEFDLPVGPGELIEEFTAWVPRAYSGAVELLQELSGVYRLGVLSNTNVLHWTRIRDEMEMGRFFEHVFVSYRTGIMKPAAGAFTMVSESTGRPAGSIVFLDDKQVNVDAALSAGMEAYCVKGADGARKQLAELGIV